MLRTTKASEDTLKFHVDQQKATLDFQKKMGRIFTKQAKHATTRLTKLQRYRADLLENAPDAAPKAQGAAAYRADRCLSLNFLSGNGRRCGTRIFCR